MAARTVRRFNELTQARQNYLRKTYGAGAGQKHAAYRRMKPSTRERVGGYDAYMRGQSLRRQKGQVSSDLVARHLRGLLDGDPFLFYNLPTIEQGAAMMMPTERAESLAMDLHAYRARASIQEGGVGWKTRWGARNPWWYH